MLIQSTHSVLARLLARSTAHISPLRAGSSPAPPVISSNTRSRLLRLYTLTCQPEYTENCTWAAVATGHHQDHTRRPCESKNGGGCEDCEVPEATLTCPVAKSETASRPHARYSSRTRRSQSALMLSPSSLKLVRSIEEMAPSKYVGSDLRFREKGKSPTKDPLNGSCACESLFLQPS